MVPIILLGIVYFLNIICNTTNSRIVSKSNAFQVIEELWRELSSLSNFLSFEEEKYRHRELLEKMETGKADKELKEYYENHGARILEDKLLNIFEEE